MKTEPTIEVFYDSALAMIADLSLTHGVDFDPAESERIRMSICEIAQREWFRSSQCKRIANLPAPSVRIP